MSNTIASLRRKISSAADLRSVVRTMKAVAASNIGQYEKSVKALADYYNTVELGLSVCFRDDTSFAPPAPVNQKKKKEVARVDLCGVVFGSDQGLVGQFNDVISDFAIAQLRELIKNNEKKPQIWAVGERVHARLSNASVRVAGIFKVANSVQAITPLVGQILVDTMTHDNAALDNTELHLFYNRQTTGAVYEPTQQRLLPLDSQWRLNLKKRSWPTASLPEIIGSDNIGCTDGAGATNQLTLRAFIREFLFVSLFRACAESLVCENASRLAAMQRADKNINELLEDLNANFHRLRQGGIDEELFDVVSGFEAFKKS